MFSRLFLFISLTLISILPIANLKKSEFSEFLSIKNRVKNIYSLDLIEGRFNKILFSMGISNVPSQVLIGTDRWLFLGDNYEKTITNYRKGSDGQKEHSQKIIEAQSAWAQYLLNKDINDFKIIIGPNKSTIYSEKLPEWIKSGGGSLSKNLYKSDVYINAIDELIEAKTIENTYERTDTHWNSFGASVAFKKLIKSLNKSKDFIYPGQDFGEIVQKSSSEGGDLAEFLKAHNYISGSVITTKINLKKNDLFIYDYNSKNLVYRGNINKSGSNRSFPFFNRNNTEYKMTNIYHIHNPEAINNSKLLWLGDSFGRAMTPYMTETFSDILMTHWVKVAGTSKLIELLEEWRPDYVIYTVVERSSLSHIFLKHPPKINENQIRGQTSNG